MKSSMRCTAREKQKNVFLINKSSFSVKDKQFTLDSRLRPKFELLAFR